MWLRVAGCECKYQVVSAVALPELVIDHQNILRHNFARPQLIDPLPHRDQGHCFWWTAKKGRFSQPLQTKPTSREFWLLAWSRQSLWVVNNDNFVFYFFCVRLNIPGVQMPSNWYSFRISGLGFGISGCCFAIYLSVGFEMNIELLALDGPSLW